MRRCWFCTRTELDDPLPANSCWEGPGQGVLFAPAGEDTGPSPPGGFGIRQPFVDYRPPLQEAARKAGRTIRCERLPIWDNDVPTDKARRADQKCFRYDTTILEN